MVQLNKFLTSLITFLNPLKRDSYMIIMITHEQFNPIFCMSDENFAEYRIKLVEVYGCEFGEEGDNLCWGRNADRAA
jgi:hypothetical protein